LGFFSPEIHKTVSEISILDVAWNLLLSNRGELYGSTLINYFKVGSFNMFNHTKGTRRLAGRMVKLLAGAAFVLGTASAYAGIAATKHNLGASNGSNINYMTTGTTEICVFCHTPHASNTNVKAPLWNKPVNGGTYTTYTTAVSATIDGSVDMTGVSLACLSCHDGTQAMDTMINKPGSGGYNAAGSVIAGGVWTGANQTAGKLNSNTVALLGTDLTNDHPVGIQYCGGGISTGSASTTAASTGTCRDSDFIAPANSLIGGARAWWVDNSAGTTGTREKTDMILYARAPTLAGDSQSGFYQPFVECGSCHDPHNSTNATFLRIPNAQSAVCLTCHNK
jgi:predicted CXXCH cytochrome family protein